MAIRVRGARENNLRGVDAEFPDGLTVVTGVSGSGKSSLAFDTVYHEARRRFLDLVATGAGAPRLAPARVDSLYGLRPAVAVGQDLLNRNPSSTVATACGLHPFLRLLYARFGVRTCAHCGTPLLVLSEDEAVARLLELASDAPTTAFAPLVTSARGSHRTLLQLLLESFPHERLRVDAREPNGPAGLDPATAHTIEVVVGRLSGPDAVGEARRAVTDALALGCLAVVARAGEHELRLPLAPSCPVCAAWFAPLEPTHFHRACPTCAGDGCDSCAETGLHPLAAATRWAGLRLPDLLALSVAEVADRFDRARLPASAARLGSEIGRRLDALLSVGLGYVGLDRPSPTLSRGEAQRVRIAVALTSRLHDLLHVLDEPTIGQHPADVARLLPAFRQLEGPVSVVEHDRVAAAAADHAIDLGPGAGTDGGAVVFAGPPEGLWAADTPTGRHFSLRARVALPARRGEPDGHLVLRGADLRNLRGIDVPLALRRLNVVTGVSGSGKSTLVEDVLCASLDAGRPVGCAGLDTPPLKTVLIDQKPIGRNPRSNPATYTKLADILRDHFAAATGLTPSHFSFNRDEGACGACGGLGALEVRMRYLPSVWVPCAACGGERFHEQVLEARAAFGTERLSIAELYALPVEAAARLLAVASPPLPPAKHRAAERIYRALLDVGLGYLPLGQPSPSLSGGEAQRVKLAKHLGRRSLSGELVVLDEPSTGLHPADIGGLLVVLDRLVAGGATVVVVEHNTDVIRAAEWVVDLGPGSGPDGGDLVYAGSLDGLVGHPASATGRALAEEAALRTAPAKRDPRAGAHPNSIRVRGARAHNLRAVDVDLPKGALTVVTGVSGSGKSSLVHDVLETEARRRLLESLSLYERQGTREGPEADVDGVAGLGVALAVSSQRGPYDGRRTVGSVSEIWHHLAVLLAWLGERACPECGADLVRANTWSCPRCGATAPIARPRHFDPRHYSAACRTCQGVGSLQRPRPEKLVIHPERPLCAGAMHSPGFFPKGYLCQPGNGGYDMVQALAARFGFDPATTPWREMSEAARDAFLYGTKEPIEVTFRSRGGRTRTGHHRFPGFYGWIRDWDVGGTYTDTETCPDCGGGRLRPEYLAVRLAGANAHALDTAPLSSVATTVDVVPDPPPDLAWVSASLAAARRRLAFLIRVGLGYLHLGRISATLSAGEAQRVRLAGLLASGLTSMTVLADEPSRGLHPAEVAALARALQDLRDEGNTVIVVEHDPVLIEVADHIVDLGPGAGRHGGRVVAQGPPAVLRQADTCTGAWLRGERRPAPPPHAAPPDDWLTIRGPRAHNLDGRDVRLPLRRLVGICGPSGSGKSTLVVDTLGRALAPRKHTTSVASEPIAPGAHDGIDGAPGRTVIVDQARAGIGSPAAYLGLEKPLLAHYGESGDARALGLDAATLGTRCSACGGAGLVSLDMGFLPDVHDTCETCGGTGLRRETWQVRRDGLALPDAFGLTIDEVAERFADAPGLAPALAAARSVGLGYLVLRQPGRALSGGEAQRLKIARELGRRRAAGLYILDEPTVGQHLEDVARLVAVLRSLVEAGHGVLVVEHHPHVLAACDWLVELGPGGGPEGGSVVAQGPPARVAEGATATAPYLAEALRCSP